MAGGIPPGDPFMAGSAPMGGFPPMMAPKVATSDYVTN